LLTLFHRPFAGQALSISISRKSTLRISSTMTRLFSSLSWLRLTRVFAGGLIAAALSLGAVLPAAAQVNAKAPDEFIRILSTQVLDQIKQDKTLRSGDIHKLAAFVDESVMPNVDFERMTALSVGRNWREATPEQQKQLMTEFRTLLLRTYAGALTAVNDQQIRVKPLRAAPEDTEVVVRSEIVQARGEPIQLDYRLEKKGDTWRIFNLNIGGVWLVETYRNQFTQEITAKGMDGLIQSLAERNRKFAQAAKAS
jgi:phospholipid transport system substrate-binding protein